MGDYFCDTYDNFEQGLMSFFLSFWFCYLKANHSSVAISTPICPSKNLSYKVKNGSSYSEESFYVLVILFNLLSVANYK